MGPTASLQATWRPPVMLLSALSQDARYALRVFRASPGFALISAVSLAIGIGANAAVFSLADAALLRRLPVGDPHQLVELVAVHRNHRQNNLPSEVLPFLSSESRPVADLFASQGRPVRLLAEGGIAARVPGLFASENYFAVLRVGAAAGRVLDARDQRPGAPRVCMVSHSLWRERFAGRADVIGTAIQIDREPTTIVGVMPSGFVGVDRSVVPAVVMPLSADPPTVNLWIAGRLKTGVSLPQAEARLRPAYATALEEIERVESWPPEQRDAFRSQRLALVPASRGTAHLRWQLEEPLRILAFAVLALFAIACTNVAVLTLSRADQRSREIATRLALGASRSRLVRQLLVESALLALLAGIASLAVAFGLHRLLLGLWPLDPSAAVAFQLDGHLAAFALLASTLAALGSGLAPALHLVRLDLRPGLRGESGALGRGRLRMTRRILVAQIAGTLVLLAAAGLFLRSLANLVGVDAGFDRRRLVSVRLSPVDREEGGSDEAVRVSRLVGRVRAQAGVESAAASLRTVFATRNRYIISVWVDGVGEKRKVAFNAVDPEFFDTVGLPLRTGRAFRESDDLDAPRVAVVSDAFARRYLAEGQPLGRRLGSDPEAMREIEVVGVVADARVWSLRDDPEPMVYLPISQKEQLASFSLQVRLREGATDQFPALVREIARADPTLEIIQATTLEQSIRASLREESLLATLTSVFGAMALSLVGVGLFGTMAFATARRVREIGIRMAVGATRGRVLRMLLGETATVLAMGLGCGLVLAAMAVRSLHHHLFGLPPWDAWSFLGAAALLSGVGLIAGLVPARTAASRPSAVALRHE